MNWELSDWLERIHTFDDDGFEGDRAREQQLFFDHLRAYHERYEIDEVLMAIANIGGAPSLLYDDNGHWTIGGDGSQNLPAEKDYKTKTTTLQGCWYVPPNHWQSTPREALAVYLENWGKE